MSLERRSVRCTVVRGRPGTKTGSIGGTWSSSEAASASDASVGILRVRIVSQRTGQCAISRTQQQTRKQAAENNAFQDSEKCCGLRPSPLLPHFTTGFTLKYGYFEKNNFSNFFLFMQHN